MLTLELAREIHEDNKRAGWWTNIETGEPLDRCHAEMKLLQITELSEAMEGYRRNRMDTKLPQYKMLDVEFVDCIIRQLDLVGYLSLRHPDFEFPNRELADLAEILQDETVPQTILNLIGMIYETNVSVEEQYSEETFAKCVAALITVHDVAVVLGVDVEEIMEAKRAFNATRADHKIENRLKTDGKKC